MKIIRHTVFALILVSGATGSVAGQDNANADTILLTPVVITAEYLPVDSRNTVSSVRVIDKKEIAERAPANLLELLQTEEGLRITFDPILGSGVSINGLPPDNVKILVDGVPVVGRLNGAVDLSQIQVNTVRQVEMIDGAQSLLYGSSAAAGVINLVTNTQQVYRVEGHLQGLLESNGFQILNGGAGVDLGNFNFGADAGMNYFRPTQDTGRAQVWNPKDQISGRMYAGYSNGEALQLTATVNLFDEEVSNLGDVRRPQFRPYAFDDYYRTDRRDFNIRGQGWINPGLYWQGTAAYNYFNRTKNTYRLNFEDGSEELMPGLQDTSGATGILVRGALASDRDEKRWDYLAGIEYYRETLADRRIMDSTQRSGFAQIFDLGVFGSAKYRITDELLVQGGARYTYNSRYGSALTPSVWLAWRPRSGFVVKASYANGFRSPNLKELFFEFIDINHFIIGNPDLEPERSHNVTAQVSRQFALSSGVSLETSVNAFYNKITDRITLAEFEQLKFSYQNIDEWQTTGGGATARLETASGIKFGTAFILTGFYNSLSQESGVSTMSLSPDWTNELKIPLLKKRLNLNAWHKLTGRTPFFYLEDGETKEGSRDGWNLLNGSVDTQLWNRRITLTAGVKNILNIREIDQTGFSGGAHGGAGTTRPIHWGRSYFIQVNMRLHSTN